MSDNAVAGVYERKRLDGGRGDRVLYDLVDEGMNLHPKVYARVQKKLQELGA